MSLAMNTICPSKNTTTTTTTIHSLNINNTLQNDHNNNNKVLVEKLASDLEENTHVLNSNLIEKLDKKSNDEEKEDETQVKRDDHGDNNKVDEDLSKWEQQTLGSMIIGTSAIQEKKGRKVEILNLRVASPGRKDNVIEVPFPNTTSKATLFTLKEGTKYRILFYFKVSNTLVNALTYSYTVWKAGIKVNQTKKMVGTFSPREEPYTFESSEGTTPSGFFVRGPFLVKSKFMDDEGNCYMDTTYYFDIRKDWGANDK